MCGRHGPHILDSRTDDYDDGECIRLRVLHVYDPGHAQAELIAQGLADAGLRPEVRHWGEGTLANVPPPDVIHVRGASAAAARLDEFASYGRGRRIARLIQYETSEIRTRSEAVRSNFYAHLDDGYNENAAQLLERLPAVFPACIVDNAEAAEYAAKVHQRVYVVPPAIRLPAYEGASAEAGKTFVVAHLAADDAKGGEFIEKAIARLRSEGHDVRCDRISGLGHADAFMRIKKADIVVDQLFHGSYGLAAVEGMALGKPVLSHLRADLVPKSNGELPIVSANPATIYRQLLALLQDKKRRRSLGEQGRLFAEKHHALEAVIPLLTDAYRKEMEASEVLPEAPPEVRGSIRADGLNRQDPPSGAGKQGARAAGKKRTRRGAGRASVAAGKRRAGAKRRRTKRNRRSLARFSRRSFRRGIAKRARSGRGRRAVGRVRRKKATTRRARGKRAR